MDVLRINRECFSWKLLQITITFVMVSFAWIFFRADSISDALTILWRMVYRFSPWVLFNGGLYSLGLSRYEMNIFFCSMIVLIAIDLVKYIKKQAIDQFLFSQNMWFRWAFIVLLIISIFIYGEYGPSFDAKQFIYFQF